MASERSGLASTAYFCGIIGLACLVLGIGGIQIGLFPPMLGFGLFALATVVGGLSATLLGVIALIRKKSLTGPDDRKRAQTGAALGFVLLILLFLSAGTDSTIVFAFDDVQIRSLAAFTSAEQLM